MLSGHNSTGNSSTVELDETLILQETWTSPSNIALIKYWGKYGNQLPCNPSISITLDEAKTTTTVALYPKSSSDKIVELEYYFEDERVESFESRVQKFLEKNESFIPAIQEYKIVIHSSNSFPHSTGIASSASAFSAMAVALISTFNKIEGNKEISLESASELARLGSGSASRSVFANYALWGESEVVENSSNNYAIPVTAIHPDFLEMRDSILIVDNKEKSVSSSIGHGLMNDNPYAETRFKQAKERIPLLLEALKEGDWDSFIHITESEALTLHAMMMSSKDYYLLFHPNTIEIINKVFNYRKETGLPVCFTLDAGPNVHLLYPKSIESKIKTFIETELSPLTKSVMHDKMGEGPQKIN